MKENIYDSDSFFDAYSAFPRSVHGLSAAGEWHELKRMLPCFKGKRVLDIGCGFGWHCVYAADNGAAQVLGIDISQKMLASAAQKTGFANVEYRQLAMEDMDFEPDSFDIAISSLALHYTPDFAGICRQISRCIASGGAFVFSVEHPVFTARGDQQWIVDQDGNRLHWPVDSYFAQGRRSAIFLGQRVTKYHRTLADYINTLLQNGFAIDEIAEPQPTPQLLATVPQMADELRRPMMLLVSATKK